MTAGKGELLEVTHTWVSAYACTPTYAALRGSSWELLECFDCGYVQVFHGVLH